MRQLDSKTRGAGPSVCTDGKIDRPVRSPPVCSDGKIDGHGLPSSLFTWENRMADVAVPNPPFPTGSVERMVERRRAASQFVLMGG